jgi:hypothetical protein
MAYKLYLDKNNLFECDIQLQGASLKSSFARIIVEGKEHSYIFNGEIDENGHCSVELNKLKDIFENNQTGTIKLEVVADDVYFSPWEDAYQTDLSKKIDVVVKEQEEPVKPMISVSVKKQPILKESEKVVSKPKQQIPTKKTEPIKKVVKNTSENSIKVSDIKKLLGSK